MLDGRLIYTIVSMMTLLPLIASDQCKWSNENCKADDDCCSKRCVQRHQGTNPRCASSPIHFPCFYSHQCEKGLMCGDMYSCCAPFWGVCTVKGDCCEKEHVCREMDGFTYRRCLPNTAYTTQSPSTLTLSLLLSLYATLRIVIC